MKQEGKYNKVELGCSSRSIDPVYIHNYVIGAILAQKLIDYLSKMYSNDYKAWGKWLYHNIYFDGRRSRFSDKINRISHVK